jgi:hypothetical protein
LEWLATLAAEIILVGIKRATVVAIHNEFLSLEIYLANVRGISES